MRFPSLEDIILPLDVERRRFGLDNRHLNKALVVRVPKSLEAPGNILKASLLRVRNPQVCMTAWSVVLIVSMAMPAQRPRSAPPSWRPSRMPSSQRLLVQSTGICSQRASTFSSAAMMLRLLIGLMLTWQVVRAARPARHDWAAGVDVRTSDMVVVPVTFASSILLPSASAGWSVCKRQAVLLHEGSHVAHGDFYLLLLASINRAVFWWLFIRLAELAEGVSDDAAIEGLGDRGIYADILLDIATNPQRLPAGLAMAQPGTGRKRVQRILSTTALPAKIGRRRRMLTAVALSNQYGVRSHRYTGE
jgi:hypothetical protein